MGTIESQYESRPLPKPKRPRHVERFRDRHGRERFYYRPSRDAVRIALPHPSDPRFESLYEAAKAGRAERIKTERSKFYDVAKSAIDRAVYRAKRKNLQCDITAEWILDQIERQHFRCALTGIKFTALRKRGDGWQKNPYAPSPDRIDNRRGYTEDNVRIVLSAVNIALNEWGEDMLREIANGLIRTNPSGQ